MEVKFLVYLISIGVFWKTCYGFGQHYGYDHGGNSEYIHSNDTMALSLLENTELKVEADSVQALQFTLTNRGKGGHFSFSKTSEDGLLGRLQETEKYLEQDDSTTIRINNIRIPERPHNSKVTLTLTVSRDSPLSKRSAQGQGGQFGGQGNSMGGGGGFNPNNNDNRFPNNNGNRVPNFWNDPSNRRELTLTVEFTVVDPDEAGDREEHDPWIQAVYSANTKEDTCRDVSQSFCGDKWWWVQFTTADSGSGLRRIDMDKSRPTNGGRPDFNTNQDDTVYFRYKNFNIGTDDEVDVVAGTSCCNEHMRIVVTDVDGNDEEFTAYSDKYGESTYVGNLTKTAFWGIIGGVIALVLIIIAVSIWCCVRNKCKGYSNPNAS